MCVWGGGGGCGVTKPLLSAHCMIIQIVENVADVACIRQLTDIVNLIDILRSIFIFIFPAPTPACSYMYFMRHG